MFSLACIKDPYETLRKTVSMSRDSMLFKVMKQNSPIIVPSFFPSRYSERK